MSDTRAAGDNDARALALEVTRSFIVQAPAGSGKTELLLQRYLALLARVEQPEAIVAMTFTRKAAGEIRQRILAALRDATATSPAEPHRALTRRLATAALERDAALGWNLLAHPARLQVHTIDALCVALMRQAPLTVKLGALPRLVERAEPMYVEAARAELDAAPADDAVWRRLLERLDNDADRVVALIASLLGRREQWLPRLVTADATTLRAALEDALTAEIQAELAALEALLPRAALAPLTELLRYAAGNLIAGDAAHPLAASAGRGELPRLHPDGLAHWRAIADWLLTRRGTFPRSLTAKRGFPPRVNARGGDDAERDACKRAMQDLLSSLAAVPGLAAALHAVRKLPPPRYDDAAWSYIEALLAVLPRVAARLELVFAQASAIDFSEATLIAVRALMTDDVPSDLLLSLDARIEHLLVDEFQDTSLAQCELIESLTAGWTHGDGRTLFLVGDPLQSIYRFRDADVSLFLEAQRRRRIGGVALEPLTLAHNFRSHCGLVQWVNRIFPQVLSPRDEPGRGAVAFKPAVAMRESGPEPAVTIDLSVDDAEEAATVVSRVRAALATDAKDIAVLVRKRADLSELLPALRAAGVAFAAVDLDRLSERQALLDLASLAHALVQPGDRAAWLATLRAPWCGLTLPDMFAIVEVCGSAPLSEAAGGGRTAEALARLSPDGRLRLERFASVIAPALRDRGRLPLATMVRGAWLALGGPACVTEAIDLPAAERVFALLDDHAVGADVPDWPAFAAALDVLYAEEEIDSATRVRIMTLHRAKGLEFDVVIMPGMARGPKRSESQLLLWRQRPAGLLLAPIRARTMDNSDDDPVYAYLRSLAAAEDDAELGRLLYVGCTRARRNLHLTATLAVDRDVEGNARWKAPARGSSLAAIWPALQSEAPVVRVGAPADPRQLAETGVPLTRLPQAWRLPPPPVLELPAAPDVRLESEPVEFDWVRETARQIGTVAHRLLRQIAEDGVERWTPARVEAQRPRVAQALSALGFTGAEATAAVEQVLASIRTTLADPRGRWLFDPEHADAHSEFALTEWRDGAFVHRVLDRTFVDADGTRWIVDFKLSQHEGTGVDAFLDNERERYQAQLGAYAGAMRSLDGRPIRLGLYFPLLAGWREWPGPAPA
ncbi:MAG: UvrD-helicase domain-containing protein [Pseudomonadota bacterium]|nr:UvrD-helicase domain-containing protein [Pseudomonadota bacterium]